MFITDLNQDPYKDRLVFLFYGRPKTGKTQIVLRMIEAHPDQLVYLISGDKGTKAVALDSDKYKGKLAIAYPLSLREWRETIAEATTRIERVVMKKPSGSVWCVIDTVTHMQVQLLAESRKLNVSNAKGGKARIQDDDEYVRDLLTQVDYNVNLGHMAELTNAVLRLPCNVVMMALEKQEAVDRYDTEKKRAVPALAGQSKEKIVGDADIIGRLVVDKNERKLLLASGEGWDAGDRTGRLAEVEVPDLWALRQKVFTKP